MTGLPAGAVIGIAAAGTVVGAGLLGGIAYGIRELVFDHTARTAQLVPIAIKNNSRQTISASLRSADDALSTLSDAHYSWRALLGIGVMSVDIEGDKAEELNPPTVTDSGSTESVLTIASSFLNPDSDLAVNHEVKLSCRVSRGDVVTFDGQTLSKIEADSEDSRGWIYLGLKMVSCCLANIMSSVTNALGSGDLRAQRAPSAART